MSLPGRNISMGKVTIAASGASPRPATAFVMTPTKSARVSVTVGMPCASSLAADRPGRRRRAVARGRRARVSPPAVDRARRARARSTLHSRTSTCSSSSSRAGLQVLPAGPFSARTLLAARARERRGARGGRARAPARPRHVGAHRVRQDARSAARRSLASFASSRSARPISRGWTARGCRARSRRANRSRASRTARCRFMPPPSTAGRR